MCGGTLHTHTHTHTYTHTFQDTPQIQNLYEIKILIKPRAYSSPWQKSLLYSQKHFEGQLIQLQPQDEELVAFWYILDEFGSRICHSDEPNVELKPLFHVPTQMSFTVMWLLNDLEYGGTTCKVAFHLSGPTSQFLHVNGHTSSQNWFWPEWPSWIKAAQFSRSAKAR